MAPDIDGITSIRKGAIILAGFASLAFAASSEAACFEPQALSKAEVVALGAYEGGTDIAYSFPAERDSTGLIMVGANKTGKPLVLVLSAYSPTVWNLKAVPAGRLKAVLVYGYSAQAVTGITASVPVRITTRKSPLPECGKHVYAYKGGGNLNQLAAQVESVLGKPIVRFHGDYDPKVLHADLANAPQIAPDTRLSARTEVSQELTHSAIPPKEAGLRALITVGAIRPARPADVVAWNAAATKASPTGHLAPVESEYLRVQDSYVVLRTTEVPTGMYGAHSASFIIPKGVEPPVDRGSHNKYYFLSDGTCMGTPECSRERQGRGRRIPALSSGAEAGPGQ